MRLGAHRLVLLVVVATLALVAVVAGRVPHAPSEGPWSTDPKVPRDVVLIVIDTLRADHLRLYGYERDTAPHLSAFARQAVTYRHAVAPGTWTVPSHATMFTGLWPSQHGAERAEGDRVTARPMRPEVRTLAEILGESGFHSAAFVGNWTFVTPSLGFGRGFREFFDGEVSYPPSLASAFTAWLPAQRDRLFVFVNFLDPHEPFEPPPPLDEMFPKKHPEFGAWITRAIYDDKRPVTPELVEHFHSQYDGEIVFVDRALESLFESLKKAGRWNDALVIVTSDHGELFGEHGLGGHVLMPFEPLVQVPLLVKYPHGRRAGEIVERRVSTRAIFGSILASAGVAQPPDVDAPELDQPHDVWVEHLNETGVRERAGYDGDLKVFQYVSPQGERLEVFDLAADPGEERPLADQGGDAARPLRERLAAFSALPRPVNAQQAPVVDPVREVQLRHLGYVQ
jgi:arylsulfatase A-like enzyme